MQHGCDKEMTFLRWMMQDAIFKVMNPCMTVRTTWQQRQYTTLCVTLPPPKPLPPDTGGSGAPGPATGHCKIKPPPHDTLAAPCLRRPLSFNAALFMRSLVPCSLLYLSSVLWLLRRPPQLLSPYVRGGDRSEYSEYSHCPATAFPAMEDP